MSNVPVPPLKTMGVAIDAKGDVWQAGPSGSLNKVVSAGNGGGGMEPTLGEIMNIQGYAPIPAGWYVNWDTRDIILSEGVAGSDDDEPFRNVNVPVKCWFQSLGNLVSGGNRTARKLIW